jgi:hypothetical protein
MTAAIVSLINLVIGIWVIYRVIATWNDPRYKAYLKPLGIAAGVANIGLFIYRMVEWLA